VTLVSGWTPLQKTCFTRTCFHYSSLTASRRYHRKHYEQIPDEQPFVFSGTVDVLDRGEHHVVVSKPPSVVCHHSDWSGSRSHSKKMKLQLEPEVPMLQRTREAVQERVNLVHRLDRGASGCLLMTLAKSDEMGLNATATLQQAMTTATKTYVALVRGEGILQGRDFKREGWFEVSRPIKDEKGRTNDATTYFRFLAGQDNGNGTLDRPRASLVLARPKSGRWHQIRRHLNGLSHPIIGDSSHGNSKVNREWKQKYGLPPERTCLHLLQLEISPNSICPKGINVKSPLAPDMISMLQEHLPAVLEDARAVLLEEGLQLEFSDDTIASIPVQFEC
jgi:tRNA pseudouridine65 synthase